MNYLNGKFRVEENRLGRIVKPLRGWVCLLSAFILFQGADIRFSRASSWQEEEIPPSTSQQDSPSLTQSTGGLGGDAALDVAAGREEVEQALVNEIRELTPGGIATEGKLRDGVAAAVRAFLDNDPQGMLEQMDRLKGDFPELPPSSLALAALYFTTGNGNEGMWRLEEAANVAPTLPSIYNAFARVAISQGRLTDARVLLEKNDAMIQQGKWSKVQQDYFVNMHADAMADLLLARNDFGSARRYLTELLSRQPEMSKSVMRLAQIDFREKKLDDCLKRLEEFQKLNPDSRVPELMMATMLVQAGQEPEAEAWVQKALQKYPKNQAVLVEFVDWMVAHEKFDEAAAVLEQSETMIGSLPAIMMLKGKMAFAQGKYAEAEALFSTLRSSEPSNVEVATMLAIAMAEVNDPEKLGKAVEIAAQNAQLQPRNATTAAVLGYLLLKQKNLSGAGEWLNRSTQSGVISPEAAFYIAKFLSAQGDAARAVELVNNALSNPGLFLYRRQALELKQQLSGEEESLTPPDGK